MRWSESLCAFVRCPFYFMIRQGSGKKLLCLHAMRPEKRLLVGKSDKTFVTCRTVNWWQTIISSSFRLFMLLCAHFNVFMCLIVLICKLYNLIYSSIVVFSFNLFLSYLCCSLSCTEVLLVLHWSARGSAVTDGSTETHLQCDTDGSVKSFLSAPHCLTTAFFCL